MSGECINDLKREHNDERQRNDAQYNDNRPVAEIMAHKLTLNLWLGNHFVKIKETQVE